MIDSSNNIKLFTGFIHQEFLIHIQIEFCGDFIAVPTALACGSGRLVPRHKRVSGDKLSCAPTLPLFIVQFCQPRHINAPLPWVGAVSAPYPLDSGPLGVLSNPADSRDLQQDPAHASEERIAKSPCVFRLVLPHLLDSPSRPLLCYH